MQHNLNPQLLHYDLHPLRCSQHDLDPLLLHYDEKEHAPHKCDASFTSLDHKELHAAKGKGKGGVLEGCFFTTTPLLQLMAGQVGKTAHSV